MGFALLPVPNKNPSTQVLPQIDGISTVASQWFF